MPRRFKLVIAYDGTDFKGWQRLPGAGRTGQECLERALSFTLGAPCEAHGAGRTDAGVHALGQVAHFDADGDKPSSSLLEGLRASLPADMSCLSCEEVDSRFHARHWATAKRYRYRLLVSESADPFARRFTHHAGVLSLDLAAMREAAGAFTGEHNFQSFTNLKEKDKSFVRRVDSVQVKESAMDVTGSSLPCVDILFMGEGFLHNQARIMAGALLEAGKGRLDSGDMKRLLSARDRSLAPPMLPACGLCLMGVDYGDRNGAAGSPRLPIDV